MSYNIGPRYNDTRRNISGGCAENSSWLIVLGVNFLTKKYKTLTSNLVNVINFCMIHSSM